MEKMNSQDLIQEESPQLAQSEGNKEVSESSEMLNHANSDGMDVDYEDVQFHSLMPVFNAIDEGCDHVQLTTLLIEAAKDPQSKMKVMLKVFEILIRLGIDVNSQTNDQSETPLEVGVSQGSVLWTKFFLRNGARLANSKPLIKLLNSGSRDSQEILLLLLRYGQDIGFCNANNENLLHVVSKLNYDQSYAVGIAEILLNAGLPLEEPDGTGFSPLHYAVDNENLELTSFFIERGANVNKKVEDDFEIFPLFMATTRKNKKLVELLLANGADVHAETSNKWTVLHQASVPGFERIIFLYLQKGLIVSKENDSGETPFYYWMDYESDLYFNNEDKHWPFTFFFVKKIANQKFDSSILQCDEELIQASPSLKKHYENCLMELSEMSNMVFHAPYSYYSILKMFSNLKKLSKLTKNEEFMKNFEANLSPFPNFKDELQSIVNKAVKVKNEALDIERRLKSAFGTLFPDVILRKLVDNLCIEDLPLNN